LKSSGTKLLIRLKVKE